MFLHGNDACLACCSFHEFRTKYLFFRQQKLIDHYLEAPSVGGWGQIYFHECVGNKSVPFLVCSK